MKGAVDKVAEQLGISKVTVYSYLDEVKKTIGVNKVESIFEAGNLKSNGHYALAVIHQNTVCVSGQFAIDPITQEKKFGTIEEETLQVLSNIEYILKSRQS